MFKFFKKYPQNKQLDEIIQNIEVNAANNYKDAAQEDLREFEETLKKLAEEGKLSDKQRVYYREKLGVFQRDMKSFTHKDQKPTWT